MICITIHGTTVMIWSRSVVDQIVWNILRFTWNSNTFWGKWTMNEMNTVQIAIAFGGVHWKFYQTFWQKLSRSTWPRLECAGKCFKLRRVGRTAVMSRFLHNGNTREDWELFFDLNRFTKVVSLAFFLSRGILLPHIQNNLQASSTIN